MPPRSMLECWRGRGPITSTSRRSPAPSRPRPVGFRSPLAERAGCSPGNRMVAGWKEFLPASDRESRPSCVELLVVLLVLLVLLGGEVEATAGLDLSHVLAVDRGGHEHVGDLGGGLEFLEGQLDLF